jgi:hypothetical protein
MRDEVRRSTVVRRHAARVAAALMTVGCIPVSHAAGANPVPAQYQGNWVPASGSCDSPLRMQVSGDQLTLVNGKDVQSVGGIEMAGPGFFSPGYQGIMAVAITEFDGHQPVTATFNPDEKKGAARLEIARVAPGRGNPRLNAYNAHIAKLNLVKRFPLDQVMLKKCP